MLRIAIASAQASPLMPASSPAAGGRSLQVTQLAHRYAEAGHSVDVYTRQRVPGLPPIIDHQPRLRIIQLPETIERRRRGPNGSFGTALATALRRERYDLLHAVSVASGLCAYEAARAQGLPLLVNYRSVEPRDIDARGAQAQAFVQSARAMVLRHASRVIACSDADRQLLIARYGLAGQRIDVVPYGFDPQELTPMSRAHARQTLGWNAEVYTLLRISRHVNDATTANLVRALARLRDHHGIYAALYIVGHRADDTRDAGLRELIAHCGLDDRVHLLPRCGRECLSYLYHAADLLVAAPQATRSGMAPVEAMACGTPVIGLADREQTSLVIDGVTGCRVPTDNPMALAATLARLEQRPALRHAYGRAARRHARTTYAWRQIARDMLSCYHRAINDVAVPARALPSFLETDTPMLQAG